MAKKESDRKRQVRTGETLKESRERYGVEDPNPPKSWLDDYNENWSG